MGCRRQSGGLRGRQVAGTEGVVIKRAACVDASCAASLTGKKHNVEANYRLGATGAAVPVAVAVTEPWRAVSQVTRCVCGRQAVQAFAPRTCSICIGRTDIMLV